MIEGRRRHRPWAGGDTKTKPSPPVVHRVDPQMWAKAMELAGGDVTRIERVSSTVVIVRNGPLTGPH